MKKLKSKLNIRLSLLFCLGLLLSSALPASAAFYANRTVTYKAYSLPGLLVVQETLHADGYSTATSGEVTDAWLITDRCYWPNLITGETDWTALHPSGEYAKGSFKLSFGLSTQWAAIGTSGTTKYLSILF